MTRFVVYHIYRKPSCQLPVACNMEHASSSAALRLCGSSALHLGQMQLVFKCGRVNEHKAKTSHHLAGFLELLLPMASTKVFLPTAKFIVAMERGKK